MAFIRMMTSSCEFLCRFAVFASRTQRKLLFQCVDQCPLGWPCCWARCWMLEDMDHMEASCIFYVKVGRFDQFEQSKISILTVTSLGMVMLTTHHDLMVSMWFMKDPGDVFRQTSWDVLSLEWCPLYIYQTWDISCRSLQCIPVNKPTTLEWHNVNCGTFGIPSCYMQCSYRQPNSAWIGGASRLSIILCWHVANYIIFRTSHFFS